MNIQFEVALIGAIQAVFVAIIGGFFARDSKKRKIALDRSERRADLRKEESMLTVGLASSSVKLGIATALAVKEGHCNGKMTTAIDEAEKIHGEYKKFIQRLASEEIAKSRG